MQKNKILVLCLLAAMCGLLASGGISIETLLEYTPQEPEKAFFLFLFLYALKSATIFFPLIFLEVASGYLFPTWMALLLNFTGILLILTIPYWMGKALGLEIVQKAAQRYPSSPIFCISALLTVTLSVLSAALYYVYQRSSSRSSSTEDQKKGDER